MAVRSSSGKASTARITRSFNFLPHQFMFRRVGVAQAGAGVELLGIAGVDVVGRRPAVLRDQVVLGGVHGDPVQPRIELGIAAEIRHRAVGADEGFLGDVLAFAPVVDVAPDQAGDPMLVLAHQGIEGRAVAALHAPDQLLVQLHFGTTLFRPYRAGTPVGSAMAEQWDNPVGTKVQSSEALIGVAALRRKRQASGGDRDRFDASSIQRGHGTAI